MSRVVAVDDARGKSRVVTVNDDPSLTVQSDVERADIRAILKRYKDVGIVDHLANVDAMFQDVTAFDDYRDAMRHAKDAEQTFMKLPAKVRAVFDHDVGRWLDAAHDPEKMNELRPGLEKLGLLEPQTAPAAAVATPPASEAPEGASDA